MTHELHSQTLAIPVRHVLRLGLPAANRNHRVPEHPNHGADAVPGVKTHSTDRWPTAITGGQTQAHRLESIIAVDHDRDAV